jgi:TfoX/Sxy family transcriptional regulator of competence genes
MDVQPLFGEAAERLRAADPGIEPARMFSASGLKTEGKFFAMVSKGDLVVKLPEERVDQLVGEGAAPFEVGNRRMREWVRVEPENARTCESLMTEARDFVTGLAHTR